MNEDLKLCKYCDAQKPVSQFARTTRQGRTVPTNKCIECKKRYHREYYQNNYAKNKVPHTSGGEDIYAATAAGRTCKDCTVWKKAADFCVVKSTGNLFSYCTPCTNKRNADRSKLVSRTEHLRKQRSLRVKNRKNELMQRVIIAYGGACYCCGEPIPEFLTLDHKNNDGAEHRKLEKIATGFPTWKWADTNNYPDFLQLSCWNCNSGKARNGGVCPHENWKVH